MLFRSRVLRIVGRYSDRFFGGAADVGEIDSKVDFAVFAGLEFVGFDAGDGATAGGFGGLHFEQGGAGVREVEFAGERAAFVGDAEVLDEFFELNFGVIFGVENRGVQNRAENAQAKPRADG